MSSFSSFDFMKPWSSTEALKVAFVDLLVSDDTDISVAYFPCQKRYNHVGFSEMRTQAVLSIHKLVSWKRLHSVVNTRRISG